MFMPPVSRVPGRARGELCMETTAILHMKAVSFPVTSGWSTHCMVPMIIRISGSSDHAAVHSQVPGAQVILVRLRPAQKIEAGQPLLDRALQSERLGQQPHRESAVGGVIAAVVQQ